MSAKGLDLLADQLVASAGDLLGLDVARAERSAVEPSTSVNKMVRRRGSVTPRLPPLLLTLLRWWNDTADPAEPEQAEAHQQLFRRSVSSTTRRIHPAMPMASNWLRAALRSERARSTSPGSSRRRCMRASS